MTTTVGVLPKVPPVRIAWTIPPSRARPVQVTPAKASSHRVSTVPSAEMRTRAPAFPPVRHAPFAADDEPTTTVRDDRDGAPPPEDRPRESSAATFFELDEARATGHRADLVEGADDPELVALERQPVDAAVGARPAARQGVELAAEDRSGSLRRFR